jgi:hypothetical protein
MPAIVPATADTAPVPAGNAAPAAREQAAARPATMSNPVAPPVIGEFMFRFDAPLRDQLDAVMQDGQTARILFPVSEHRVLDLGITRHDVHNATRGDLFALVDDAPLADAVLSYVDEAVAGSIVTPDGELFVVRYAGNGIHRVMQLDPDRMPAEAEPLVPRRSASAVASTPGSGSHMPVMQGDQAGAGASTVPDPVGPGVTIGEYSPPMAEDATEPQIRDGSTVTFDVMVVYTAQSRINNGGTSGMNALINAAVAKANLAYRNSLAPVFMRLVHTAEVGYPASGSLGTDLGALQNPSDGKMDVIYSWRTQYNADVISLFVNGGDAAGLGYLINPEASGAGALNWMLSVVVDVYADGNISFAHEVGHNFGCGHGMENGGGVFSFAGGYRFFTNNQWYRTVMAYAPGARIPYFSNPAVGYLGAPTGQASSANNVLALTRARKNAAALRFGVSDFSISTQLDVNGDTKPDLIWRNMNNGEARIWQMDGLTQTSSSVLQAAGSMWVPMLSADFNADSKPDIMWRNYSTGAVSVWFMDGLTKTSSFRFYDPVNASQAEWMPVIAGDFNGDTKPDVGMRNVRTAEVQVWYLDGVTVTGQGTLYPAGNADWVPYAAGDLNGDSKPDVVWRSASTGRVKIVHYNGLAGAGAVILLDPVNADQRAWRAVAMGDFDSDGKTDIVWRNTDSGRVKVIYMDNGVQTGVGWISN